ncbi:hypothetical protein AMECASPLE_018729 [Ameca splendens]|uniref:Uncharacterized protein n=1 Tax=Ameca splendens TaxID=208324 RepID=A0ABV0XRT8_9TELE
MVEYLSIECNKVASSIQKDPRPGVKPWTFLLCRCIGPVCCGDPHVRYTCFLLAQCDLGRLTPTWLRQMLMLPPCGALRWQC